MTQATLPHVQWSTKTTPRQKKRVYLLEMLCDIALYQLWGTEHEMTFLQEVKLFGRTYDISHEIYRWTQQRPQKAPIRLR